MPKIPFKKGFQIGEIVEVVSCAALYDDAGYDVPASPGQLLIVASRHAGVSYRFVTRVGSNVGYTLPCEVAHNVMQLAQPDSPLVQHTKAVDCFAPMHTLRTVMAVPPEFALTEKDRELGRKIVNQFTSNERYQKH